MAQPGTLHEDSSSDLSPPRSPEPASIDTNGNSASHAVAAQLGGVNVASTSAPATSATDATTTKKPRKKPGPKPADPNEPKKERKPRAPRAKKDPDAPPQSRKRKTAEAASTEQDVAKPTPQQSSSSTARQPKITDLVGSFQTPQPPSAPPPSSTVPTPTQQGTIVAAAASPALTHLNAGAPSTPRPASSGQVYDPIRSANVEIRPSHGANMGPVSPQTKLVNRASASPSITSLIDPHPLRQDFPPHQAAMSTPPGAGRMSHPSVTSAPVSPHVITTQQPPSALPERPSPQKSSVSTQNPVIPMEVDRPPEPKPSALTKPVEAPSTGTSSGAPTPQSKPARQKEAPPPLPTGSGLLSGTPFGITAGNGPAPTSQGTSIWLTYDLRGKTNTTINFAQDVIKKYGFAALHPRLAAIKEKRRQVEAASAALEKAAGTGSADDMSVDDSDQESNAEMGGMDDEGSNGKADGDKPKKRRRKAEDYDKEDDFIDDTELAWEQQALMAKDGFFVYSGPLLPEGEKPAVERADGTVKRGRGRGRGGTTRGETSGRGSRGGGRGSRGGSTVRKPRVTKADRAAMEQEKLEREKMAQSLAAKPIVF